MLDVDFIYTNIVAQFGNIYHLVWYGPKGFFLVYRYRWIPESMQGDDLKGSKIGKWTCDPYFIYIEQVML